MLDSHLEREWGIWFIYQGESYEGNVHLMTTLSSAADLAYFWQFSPIASLSNYFLADGNRQKAYSSPHSATSSTASSAESTPLSTSPRVSSRSGKIRRTKRAGGSSSRCRRRSRTRRSCTNG